MGSISISLKVNYEGVICYSAGSLPSEAHGGGWEGLGLDGREPALYFPIRSDVFLFTEIEMQTEIMESIDFKQALC